MRKSMKQGMAPVSLLLLGAMMTATAMGQQRGSVDAGLTVNLEHSQVAQTSTPGFWIKGAALDGSVSLYRGLSLAAELGGGHARINPNMTLGKLTFLAGPRYTSQMGNTRAKIFVEALFGGVHGFDSLFPSGNSIVPTANGLAMQLGGGLQYKFSDHFGLRLVELDYVHTSLPNNASNSQNDFRFATGITCHLGKK